MTNLREQLEAYIECKSEEYQKNYLLNLQNKLRSYDDIKESNQAGANDIAEMLMIACEALEYYTDLHHAPKLEEALNKIQEMIKKCEK